MEFDVLLSHLAVPRPNHSAAVDAVSAYIQQTLGAWGIPFQVQVFTLRPYMNALVGLAVLILGLLLALAVIKKNPWVALLAAVAIPLVLLVEFEFLTPTVSWLVTKPGQNIIVSLPAPDAVREIVFTAHYDSKTDFFDHLQRERIYRWIPHAIGLGVLLALGMLLSGRFRWLATRWAHYIGNGLAIALVVFWGLVELGFGGYVFLSRASPGAVDNAASVAELMLLAKGIHDQSVPTGRSNITIVLTGGEEVTLQGAHAYVQNYIVHRPQRLPLMLVNLDIIGQSGNLCYAAKNGVFLRYYTADPGLVARLDQAWQRVSGRRMEVERPSTDDAFCFQAAGVPAVQIGHSGVPGLGLGGFHSPVDNLRRIDPENLRLTQRALQGFIAGFD